MEFLSVRWNFVEFKHALNSSDQPFIGASNGSFELKQSFEVMQKVV